MDRRYDEAPVSDNPRSLPHRARVWGAHIAAAFQARNRRVNKLMAAVLTIALICGSLEQTPVAEASVSGQGQIILSNPSGQYATGSTVYASGRIAYVDECAEGKADVVYAESDVWFVPQGKIPVPPTSAAPIKLEDADGTLTTFIATVASVTFEEEVLGIASKSMNGPTDIVLDHCQDGKFDYGQDYILLGGTTVQQAAVYNNINVTLPDAIKFKHRDRAALYADLADAAVATGGMLTLIVGYYALLPGAATYTLGVIGLVIPIVFGLVAFFSTRAQRYYQLLYNDPPDPQFEQLTPIEGMQLPTTSSTDPLLSSFDRLTAAVGYEGAVAEIMLHSLERYQGAQLAGRPDWQLIHARAMRQQVTLLQELSARSDATGAAFSTALAQDTRPLDAAAAQAEAVRIQVVQNGLSADDRREFLNLGLDAAQIDQLQQQLVEADFEITVAELRALMARMGVTGAGLRSELAVWSEHVDGLIAALEADPRVADAAPNAKAGGPYSGTVGIALSLNASASTSPVSVKSYAWDLDSDGAFDDAAGVAPSFTPGRAFQGLVGLKVTNYYGLESIDYAPISVGASNGAPVFTSVSAAPDRNEVIVNEGWSFTAAATAPNGDAVQFNWLLDGVTVGSGSSFTYAPTVADLGIRVLEVVASAPQTPMEKRRHTWVLTVKMRDADGDGWRANKDCDDNDPAVNPGATEVVGNGKDDDCDDSTSDQGNPPVAAFGTSKGLNAALSDDGAKVAGSSGTGADTVLQPNGGTWQSTLSQNPTPWLVVDLAGEAPHVLHQLVLSSDASTNNVKEFRLQVSTTGTADADFVTVLSGTLPRTITPTTFSFAPTTARYVRLQVINTWGGSSAVLKRLQVWTRDREGGIVSLLEGGPVPAVVATSSVLSGSNPANMLDEDLQTSWNTASTQKSNQWAKVRLGGGRIYTVNRVVLQFNNSNSTTTAPRNFQVRVSTTTDADSAFSTIFSGSAAADTVPQVFTFPAAQAKYVQLLVVDPQGSTASSISVSTFQVLTPDGANVARLSGVNGFVLGASSVSTGTRGEGAIDYSASTKWTTATGKNTDQWLTVRLLDGVTHLVDRVQISSDDSAGIKEYEIRVSNTTPDNAAFTTVASGVLPKLDELHWVSFAPVPAKYVQLFVRSNHGGGTTALSVSQFRVYSALLGGETVAFSDYSSDADGEVVGWSWAFGDGASSSERHPTHTYAAPGTYQVQLTVEDDRGRTATTTWPYTVLPRPAVDFAWAPAEPPEGTSTSFTSTTSSVDGVILERRWSSSINSVVSPNINTSYTPTDNGTYSVKLEVFDSQFLRSSVTKSLTATNVAPKVEIQPEVDLLWGQEWNTDIWGRSKPLIMKVLEVGGGDLSTLKCDWTFGDGRTMHVASCANGDYQVEQFYPQPGTFTATLTATDKDGGSASASIVTRVAKRKSTVYIPRSQATVANGAIELTVMLVDRIDSDKSMAGRKVVLSSGADTQEVTIGANNTARVRLALPETQSVQITASFAGDSHYEPSETAYKPVLAPQLPDSKGTDFWVAFGENHQVAELKLFISSTVDTVGTVRVPGMQFLTPFTVQAGVVTTVELPPGTEIRSTDNTNEFRAPKGVHIEAQDEVTVYGLNRVKNSTDAFLGIPTDMLGTEHLLLGYGTPVNYIDPQSFYVLATEDATTVTFTLPVTTTAKIGGNNVIRPPRVPYSVVLNQGEVLLNYRMDGRDFTGGQVVANKPIAVFGGDPCANVPHNSEYCDHLVEQLPPVEAWGKEFVTMPLATRKNGDTFRFLAAKDGTEVRVNGQLVATLNRGQFHERMLAGPAHIVSTQPLLVAQYSNSTKYDNVVSDPFMMLIPPYEQFMSSYTVTTPASGFRANFINIVARQAVAAQIKLDGQLTGATFMPIPGTEFVGAQLPVSTGSHTLSGPLPFGAFMYGFDEADSYGYPGGTYLGPVASVTSVAVTPKTAQQVVGQEQCVVTTVRDQANRPLEGVRVDFAITGANPGTGAALTDSAGKATYCYTGAKVGDDQLKASVGTISDTAAVTWAAPAPTNRAPVAQDQSGSVTEDIAAQITLVATDADGDALTYTILTQPRHGTLSATGSSVTYTPTANYHGPDSFTFKVNDGKLDSNVATVSITVTPTNDVPVADAGPDQTVIAGTAVSLDGSNSSDLDGDALSFAWQQTGGPSAALTGANPAKPSFTPAAAGSYTFKLTVGDGKGGTAEDAVTITVEPQPNKAPQAQDDAATTTANSAKDVDVLVNDSDPDGDTLTVTAVGAATNGTAELIAGKVRYTPTADFAGSDSFAYTIADGKGGTAEATVTVTVTPQPNKAPAVTAGAGQATDEGGSVTVSATFTDAESAKQQYTCAVSWGDGETSAGTVVAPSGAQPGSCTATHAYADDNPTGTPSDSYAVSITVSDSGSPAASGSATLTVTVNNVAPVIAGIAAPAAPVGLGTAVQVSVSLTDVGVADTHSCAIAWGDGQSSTTTASNGACAATYTYASAGVYTIGVTATDDDGGSATGSYQYVVVYDPNGGFVTGGGWITSPAGACRLTEVCGEATGRANFGFVAKYKKGANVPEGQTEFQFKAGGLNFHSSRYDWLVVAGAKAQYKGTGTINGQGSYGFMVTAVDGQLNGGGGADKFRIKIWNLATGAVVYDNQMDAGDDAEPTTLIEGGNITIHK